MWFALGPRQRSRGGEDVLREVLVEVNLLHLQRVEVLASQSGGAAARRARRPPEPRTRPLPTTAASGRSPTPRPARPPAGWLLGPPCVFCPPCSGPGRRGKSSGG